MQTVRLVQFTPGLNAYSLCKNYNTFKPVRDSANSLECYESNKQNKVVER